jgi:uncharacterized protein YmfQ (DUF2313 family)
MAIGIGVTAETGGIGHRLDDDTVVLYRFDEPEGIRASDACGNLGDLGPESGATLGEVSSSIVGAIGRAREWGADQGLEAVELVADSTRLLRDVTVEAIVRLVTTAVFGNSNIICQRGRGSAGGVAETVLFGFRISLSAGSVATFRAEWERSSGAAATVSSAASTTPVTSGTWHHVAMARRWISTTEVEVTYHLDGVHFATVTSAHGDLGEGDGGHFDVGCQGDAAGADAGFAIDELRVSDCARTPEEIRQTYRQIFIHTAAGRELARAHLHPGATYSTDPESAIQREIAVEGDALGVALGHAEELRDDFLPDRATRTLARWERVLGLAPRSTDSIAARRMRCVGHLRRVHGFSRGQILEAIADLLDCETTDLQIVENSNRWTDEFSVASLASRWHAEANEGTITPGLGTITLSALTGDDTRWDAATRRLAVTIRTAIPDTVEAGVRVTDSIECEALVQIGARSLHVDATYPAVGLFFLSPVNGDFFQFGIRNNGGGEEFYYRRCIDGVVDEDTAVAAVPAGDVYLRLYALGDGTVRTEYSASGWVEFNTLESAIAMPDLVDWVGIFVTGGDDVGASEDVSAEIKEFRLWAPADRNVYQAYIYRDPSLGGTPDLAGAQLTLDKMSPAHINATICESLALECDSDTDLCDRDPLG